MISLSKTFDINKRYHRVSPKLLTWHNQNFQSMPCCRNGTRRRTEARKSSIRRTAELINRMQVRTAGLYLERWGFTSQKPRKKNSQPSRRERSRKRVKSTGVTRQGFGQAMYALAAVRQSATTIGRSSFQVSSRRADFYCAISGLFQRRIAIPLYSNSLSPA